MVFGLMRALSGSTRTTTLDPNKVEVVTSDVTHFWRAFDDSAKVSTERRVDVYRREYFDLASQGLKDYTSFRHVTAETLAVHVEQNRDTYHDDSSVCQRRGEAEAGDPSGFSQAQSALSRRDVPCPRVFRGRTAEGRRNELRQRHHFGGGHVRHAA
jgi:hypothetical protein